MLINNIHTQGAVLPRLRAAPAVAVSERLVAGVPEPRQDAQVLGFRNYLPRRPAWLVLGTRVAYIFLIWAPAGA